MLIRIDFETYGEADLTDVGSWVYSLSPATEVLCMAWAIDDEPVQIWIPGRNDPPFWATGGWVKKNSARVEAHNASFEQSIWANICVPRLGWDPLPPEYWEDSMAKVLRKGLPASLENAGLALDAAFKKDMDGNRNMLYLSKPRRPSEARQETRYLPGVCAEWDEKFEKLYTYCKSDVEAQREISKMCGPLSKEEQQVWYHNQLSNLRGIPVDRETVLSAIRIVDEYKAWAKSEAARITNGGLRSVLQVEVLTSWLAMNGVKTNSVDRASVKAILEREDLSPEVRTILEIRQSVSKASTAKLLVMRDRADPRDDRVRWCEQYHGASTGRVAGRALQPQNLSKLDPKIKAAAISAYPELKGGDETGIVEQLCLDINTKSLQEIINIYSDPMALVSSVVRGLIKAPKGRKFLCADYASIESRVLFWLAGDEAAVDMYRKGADIYCEMASGVYGHPINKHDHPKERQLGKQIILGCGYGMGPAKFQATCGSYGMGDYVDEAMARKAVFAYRDKFPSVPLLWSDYEEAAKTCLISREPKIAGRCLFKYDVEADELLVTLPSGRDLTYYKPKLEPVQKPWGVVNQITFLTTGLNKKPLRVSTWGGTLTENITQAVSRDITFRVGVAGLEAANIPVFLTVHDEIVGEVPENHPMTVKDFEDIISNVGLHEWAKDIPVAAEGWSGVRYRK